MTRNQMKQKVISILEDIEPTAWDDSGLHIPQKEIERAAEEIMKLWDQGFTYERSDEGLPEGYTYKRGPV